MSRVHSGCVGKIVRTMILVCFLVTFDPHACVRAYTPESEEGGQAAGQMARAAAHSALPVVRNKAPEQRRVPTSLRRESPRFHVRKTKRISKASTFILKPLEN